MNKKFFLLASMMIILLSSCASTKLVTKVSVTEPVSATIPAGSSIYVEPDLYFSGLSNDFLDLRDVTVSINGSAPISLGGRYLEKKNDMNLGNIGVLDTNIFEKAGLSEEKMSDYFVNTFINKITTKDDDYYFSYTEDSLNNYCYSTRPVIYNFESYPYGVTIGDGDYIDPIFVAGTKDNSDYTLKAKVSIMNEVVEILETDLAIQNQYTFAEHKPSEGDYYMCYTAYTEFSLVDNKTNKEVLNQKTKMPGIYVFYTNIENKYLPIQNADADAYAKFFREFDFTDECERVINKLINGMLPAFRVYYSNNNMRVKVEEE